MLGCNEEKTQSEVSYTYLNDTLVFDFQSRFVLFDDEDDIIVFKKDKENVVIENSVITGSGRIDASLLNCNVTPIELSYTNDQGEEIKFNGYRLRGTAKIVPLEMSNKLDIYLKLPYFEAITEGKILVQFIDLDFDKSNHSLLIKRLIVKENKFSKNITEQKDNIILFFGVFIGIIGVLGFASKDKIDRYFKSLLGNFIVH
jgi:hypothetical protein